MAIGLCLLGNVALAKQKQRFRSPFDSNNEQQDGQQQQKMRAPAFQPERTYEFKYNAQIAAGLIGQDEQSQAADDAQQKAITRIQALAKITFGSERHAQLCLRQIRTGQLNELVQDEQQIQPISIFEPKQIPSNKKRLLEQCCQFDYADGVIERVQFDEEDEAWSKNIKRGVLQMIQLNLKRNNAQGLRAEMDQQQMGEKQQNEYYNQENEQNKDTLAMSFIIPEIAVEGQCQTQYTINTADSSRHCTQDDQIPCSFNVTKSINFKQCSKIADVAFGYQTQQQQPQCAQCQEQLQQQEGQSNAQHICAKCDPKEVKEQKVDRTTVLRYVLKCGTQLQKGGSQVNEEQCQNCCQLERTELLAQYVYKNSKVENGQYGSAMHTVVSAQLQLNQVQSQEVQVPTQSAAQDESLMYSNEWETDEKRFYMYGDDEYPDPKSQPFQQVPKVQQAGQALRKLVQATQDQQQGIEPQQAIELQKLVKMLRMSSMQELQQIQRQVNQQQQEEKQKAKQIYMDALATCGTKNCVQKLAELINKEDMSTIKCAHSLSQLINLPAPSDQIVQTVQHLCTQSERVKSCAALRQSCLLTFGALVNELCQHKTSRKSAEQSVVFGGMQSGFAEQEQCSPDKKQQYKQAMLNEYKNAESVYQKVLALTALGNAGIDTATQQLAEIIKDKQEQRVVRVKAIDALRRVRTQQARQIQQILLPIYENTREQPEVRMAALAILMYTLPEQAVLDQLVYSIGQEPNKQVQAFAYRTLKMLANSKNPVHEEISKYAKNALKLANVDEQQLRASGKWEIPTSSKQQQEGLFITLANAISQRSSLPAYAHAQIDTVLNDQFYINDVKLYMMQQDAEEWYEQVGYQFGAFTTRKSTRGQRRSSDDESSSYSYYSDAATEYNENSRQSLRSIYSALGIKSRRSFYPTSSSSSSSASSSSSSQYDKQQQAPFAIGCLRISDVDTACIALDEQQAPKHNNIDAPILQTVLDALKSGQKPSLAHIFKFIKQVGQQQQIGSTMAITLLEKEAVIPMACGIPLRMTNTLPVLATIQGTAKIIAAAADDDDYESGNGGHNAFKVKIDVRPMVNGVHIQKMEAWTPFLVTGVESIRSVEANIPVQAELSQSSPQNGGGLQAKVRVPEGNTKLLGAHSLPVCYCGEVQQSSGLVHEPRHVRAIQNPKLDRQQHEKSTVFGDQSFGIPLHVQAHYHWPSQPLSSFPEFIQMLMATENTIHVTCKTNPSTPQEVLFRLNGEHFQVGNQNQHRQMSESLSDFYANKFEQADSDENDYEDYQQEDNNKQLGQKLQNFLTSYQPRKQYKHGLKVTVLTIGGDKEFRANAEVQAYCDAKLQVCQVKMDAQRSKIGGEQQRWIMQAKAQLVMPETVSSTAEMALLMAEKNAKFVCKAECQWGADQKQQIQIRIKGEQVQRSLGLRQQQQLKRRSAFLNKFDMEAQYVGLKPSTQNVFLQALELLKSAYYWNTNSELIPFNQRQQQQGGSQEKGKILATMVIDLITQKHANISVKTPSQLVRLQQIQLPIQLRPFPLVRQNAQSIRSIGQFIGRQELMSRAECTVDGDLVNTFDSQEYGSPLSTKCYSVLAKDCGSDQSDFVVLMKAIQQGKNGQKKLKVIFPMATIKCQTKSCANGNCKSQYRQQQIEQIQCEVNGQTVYNEDESQYVDFNNAQKSDCTVHVPGSISVRFNGRKAWLKVNGAYKNAQCGLCGHYDDQQDGENEWRMSDNKIASDLTAFHRSYALQSQGECNQQDVDDFYQENSQKIRQRYQRKGQEYDESSSDEYKNKTGSNDYEEEEEEEEKKEEEEWELENFSGNFYSDELKNDDNNDYYGCDNDDDENCNSLNNLQKQDGKNQKNGRKQGKKISPVKKTKVLEMNHDICFSKKPVKQCPRGTVPSDRTTSDFGSNSSSQQEDDDVDNNTEGETENVPYICMNRSSSEARRLLRQYRQGQRVLNVQSHGHSIVMPMQEPRTCRRA